MTEFQNQFYLFPVFNTTETKLWLSEVRLKTQKKAEDYLAEKVLQKSSHARGRGFESPYHRQKGKTDLLVSWL